MKYQFLFTSIVWALNINFWAQVRTTIKNLFPVHNLFKLHSLYTVKAPHRYSTSVVSQQKKWWWMLLTKTKYFSLMYISCKRTKIQFPDCHKAGRVTIRGLSRICLPPNSCLYRTYITETLRVKFTSQPKVLSKNVQFFFSFSSSYQLY